MSLNLSDRLAALPPYLFAQIDERKRAALAAGRDVIDFGVGDPDQPTPAFIIGRMIAALADPDNHRYPRDEGSPELRQRIAAFFRKRYGVALDPDREILVLVGSKEGLAHLPLAVVNPGQTVLVPEPGYPVYRAATLFAGGVPQSMPLREDGGWLPDLAAIPESTARATALMYLNYPNNPTGAVATSSFYEGAVALAARYGFVIAQDAAYNEVYFEEPPPSILQVPRGMEVAVEFHSLSKTFSMTGWRLGFVVGNAEVIAALTRIKANIDSGPFTAIQAAGSAAYDGYERPEVVRLRRLYRERTALLCAGLNEIGLAVRPPRATFYVWARVPAGYDSLRVATRLLEEAAVVCVPGIGFGAAGEGYVRFALTLDTPRIREAVERMRPLKW